MNILNSSYSLVGYVRGNDILNSSYSLVGYVRGNDILNSSYSIVGHFDNGDPHVAAAAAFLLLIELRW